MRDHREALLKIIKSCSESRTYSRRLQHINEVAMHAIGMTGPQRRAAHLEIQARVSASVAAFTSEQAFNKRQEKRARQGV